MAEYIEREALQAITDERINDLRTLYGDYDQYTSGYEACAELIADAPAADVVEVVRCRECTNWRRNIGFGDSPDGQCLYFGLLTSKDDFCSYGERKDGAK